MKNNKKGFTIIELVIVIAVIAILAAVLIPTFSGIIDKANVSSAEQEVRNAYTEYMSENALDAGKDGYKFCVKSSKGYYVYINNGSVIVDLKTSKTAPTTVKDTDDTHTQKYVEATTNGATVEYVIAYISGNTIVPGAFEASK